MGVKRTKADPDKTFTIDGRITLVENGTLYKAMGRSELESDYHNFIFITCRDDERRRAMFGSKYNISISKVNSARQYTLDAIDGVSVPALPDDVGCVSMTFTKIWGESVTSTDSQKFTIIVPVHSNLVRMFSIGDHADISIDISPRREDYIE